LDKAKDALRQDMRSVRAALSLTDRVTAAARAVEHLRSSDAFAGVQRIGLFGAFGHEADPRAITNGLEAFYPRVSGVQMTFCAATPDELVPGFRGIPEPPAGAQARALIELDLLIVPGLAFDARGGRVGWGRGYYDRALAGPRPMAIGFAFACQLVDEVPMGEHDQYLDGVVTEAGLLYSPAR